MDANTITLTCISVTEHKDGYEISLITEPAQKKFYGLDIILPKEPERLMNYVVGGTYTLDIRRTK